MINKWIVLGAPPRRSYKENIVTKIHDSLEEAKEEATRLCKINNERFYVYQAVAYVKPAEAPVVWSEEEKEVK